MEKKKNEYWKKKWNQKIFRVIERKKGGGAPSVTLEARIR
jgi:hypothetical protein